MTCSNCGKEIPADARFCRHCGQPSSRFVQHSVTEATTQLLETPERPPVFGHNLNEQPGVLSPQTSGIPLQSAPTSRHLDQPVKSGNSRLLLGLALIVALAFIMSGLLFAGWKMFSRPALPASAEQGPPAPPPPPGPATETVPQTDTISSALIYPGAQTTMEIKGEDGNSILQLQTPDPLDKVVEWYTEKLKPTKTMRMPGLNAVLEAGETKAIITTTGEGTSILLKQGED